MKILSQKKELTHIINSNKFFIYSRIWWDGASVDFLAVYESDQGNLVEEKWIGGESIEPKVSKLVAHTIAEESQFEQFVSSFQNLDLHHQQKMRFYMHYDIVIGVKIENYTEWLLLLGGDSDNEKISKFASDLLVFLPITN